MTFSLLDEELSGENILKEIFDLSKQKIKKEKISKNFLQKKFKKGDEISLDYNQSNLTLINPVYVGPQVCIVYEDEDLIVLNKPHGIHGHPLTYNEQNTLLNFLRSRMQSSFLGERSMNQERGLLYRLDEVTSGVIIYLKNECDADESRANFKQVVLKKIYLALVDGVISEDGEVNSILTGRGDRVVCSDDGQACSLEYQVVKCFEDKTLLQVHLKTGFRHQIRVQLASIGHPICGDELYGGRSSERVFLHAYEYCFNFKGKSLSFKALDFPLLTNFLNLDSGLEVLLDEALGSNR